MRKPMAEMSREKAAKWLDEDACIRTAEGFLGGAEMIRMGAAALRRLDELEKWLDSQIIVCGQQDGHVFGRDLIWHHNRRSVLLDVQKRFTGNMQMPPEEKPDPSASIIAKLKANQEHFTQEEQDVITEMMKMPEDTHG